MQNSTVSRSYLRTLLKLPERRTGITSGAWGVIVEGRGWHDVEFDRDQPFRWAEDGACIELAPLGSTWLSVDLDLEPGPSLGGKPLHLELRDGEGECVSSVHVAGRQTVHITVPVDPVARRVFTLRIVGDLQPVPGEPRCLGYRVYSLRESAPLLSPNIRFEGGWYAFESANGKSFRWASNGAAIRVLASRSNPVLTAELEPGPGTGQRPFRIDLLSAEGETVFTTSIRTRQHIQSRLPLKAGETGVFHFSGDESMIVHAPRDSRKLVFRTFGISIS